MNSVKIANAVICEDVRTERNGKQIIIGVYSSDILVKETPAALPIMLWLQIDEVGREAQKYEFRGLLSDHEFVKGTFSVALARDTPGRATVALGQFLLEIARPGVLKFDVKPASNGRWKNALTVDVRVNPQLAP